MTSPIGASTPLTPTPGENKREQLHAQAQALEGMFVRQLFAAMRETVPSDGITHGGAGEEMFTAMRDEFIADQLPAQWSRGLSASLVRELAAGPAAAPAAMPAATTESK
ncbi:MAG: rod-binding protein [Gemmatimonadaceae bacterium]|nr:rod-binding protein [Gemmatimonadaceae bacterium]